MHIIPRYTDDTVNIKWVPGKISEDEIEKLKNKIGAAIASN